MNADHANIDQAAPPGPAGESKSAAAKAKKRRGIVLIAVLVIVASLSYAGYQYSDMMVSEYKASENAHAMDQARRLAASGIHYAAALVSNPDNMENILGGNPFDNPSAFLDVPVPMDGNRRGLFSIIGPADPDADDPTQMRAGVSDEGAKINLNAFMKMDPSGERLYNSLLKLPNMTEDIAASIVAWLGGSIGAANGGALNDYYAGLSPPYRIKGGPMDSIAELLLVRGVTRELLYGNDVNQNGIQDENEPDTGAGFSRGWSAYLTVYSREQNRKADGKAYAFLNDADPQLLLDTLPADLSEDVAKFIILYRQYGPASKSGGTQNIINTIGALLGGSSNSSGSEGGSNSGGGGGGNNNSDSKNIIIPGDLESFEPNLLKPGKTEIKSIFELVNQSVKIKKGTDKKSKKTIYEEYQSPLNDPAMQRTELPKLFAAMTTSQEVDMPARINVNNAPRAVLAAIPELTDTDVERIVSARQALDPSSEVFQSTTWLLTEAQVAATTLKNIDKYVTARSQVFRVQSVGYFEGGKGAAVRVEAVIDANAGRPRILAWRDLTELGKGVNIAPAP